MIGGGIIGASIAYHLARDGAAVTLLERSDLATRASRGTFAWINATWAKQPRAYHALNQAGAAGWGVLQDDLSLPIRWGGSLEWFDTPERQARLREQIAEQVDWGEPARMVPAAELADLEPKVDFAGTPDAALSPNDGALDPVLATRTLADAARALGAEIRTDCDVRGARSREGGGFVLETHCGDLETDKMVLATGADPDAAERFAAIEIPQRSTPGVIVVTEPLPPLINRIIVAPGVHIHQRGDGRLVLGEQDGAPENEAHAERLRGRPNRFPDPAMQALHAERILAVARAYIPSLGTPAVEDVYIGWRPLPLDGHPVIGASPNRPDAYLAIMHSGVSLAPIVGELAAREIITGAAAPAIEAYRPGRTFERVQRY